MTRTPLQDRGSSSRATIARDEEDIVDAAPQPTAPLVAIPDEDAAAVAAVEIGERRRTRLAKMAEARQESIDRKVAEYDIFVSEREKKTKIRREAEAEVAAMEKELRDEVEAGLSREEKRARRLAAAKIIVAKKNGEPSEVYNYVV